MKNIKLLFLIFLALFPLAVAAQDTAIFVNGSTVNVNGLLHPSGVILDHPTTTTNYSDNFDGQLVISANVGDTIYVWGTYNTETNYDYFYVYDGNGRTGNQIATCTGSGSLSRIYSTTGSLTIYFHTDVSVNRTGFVLNYEIHSNHCTNSINSLSARNIGPLSLILHWTAANVTHGFLVHYGSIDTVVSDTTFLVDNLTPNTQYTFSVSDTADTAETICSRSLQVMTSGYPAVINGVRPLCGIDTLTLTADTADGYLWSTGSTARSITITQPGNFWLAAYTTNGSLVDTCFVTISALELDIVFNVPSSMCPGDSATVLVGMGSNANVRVNQGSSTLSEASRTFLPDGISCGPNGCSYRSELEFSGFGRNTRITNTNDIRYVMLNFEHSYAGDIYINITCPNAQSADIMRYGGSGSSYCNSSILPSSRGWQSGSNATTGTYFGLAYDNENGTYPCDSTASGNQPGIGWRYCWSNCNDAGFSYSSGDGLIYRSWNANGGSFDSSNVAAGTQFYHPDDSFSNLIGCPMDGIWYIEVIDGWSSDNGYIFGWELALNPNRLSRHEYQPSVAHADLLGPYAVRQSDTLFSIYAPDNLTHDTTVLYTVIITDTAGCSFDTSFSVTFHSTTTRYQYDTIVQDRLPRRIYGRTFYSDTSDVIVTIRMPRSCDSSIHYNLHVLRNTYASFDTAICANRFPIQWYHRIFNGPGTQTDTIANSVGADSILTLTMYANPIYNYSFSDTICSNDSYLFEGTRYNTAGSYTHSFYSQQGCDSLRTLDLAILNTSHGDTIVNVCDSFYWHGNSFYDSDTHFVSAYTTNHLGCDSSVTLRLTIRHSTDSNCYVSACDSYTWYGTTYTTPPTTVPVYHTTNSQGCDSVQRLVSLDLHYTQHLYDTVSICRSLLSGGYSWRDTALYPGTNSGTFAIRRADRYGCDSIMHLNLTILESSAANYYDTCVENILPRQYLTLISYGDTSNAQFAVPNAVGCDSVITYSLHVWHNVATSFDTSICDSARSTFNWNGHGAADTIVHTFATIHGADSVVTLHLTVRNSSDSNFYVSACDSYTWHGTTYTTPPATMPIFHSLNSQGCDSVQRLVSLDLHYTQHLYDTASLCRPLLAGGYSWRDTSLYPGTNSGTFTILRTDRFGCDSIMHLNLTILEASAANYYDTCVENALPRHYCSLVLYNDTSNAFDTIPNHNGCDSVINYNLHVWHNVATSFDSSICDNMRESFNWNGHGVADTIVHTFATTHGADSVVTLALRVDSTYDIHIYDTICDNSSVMFCGQRCTQSGDYNRNYLSIHSCDSLMSLHLVVNPTYEFHFYDTVYVGDTIFFEDSLYSLPGTYVHRYATGAGCDSLHVFHLTGYNIQTLSRTDTICEGDTLYFCDFVITQPGEYRDTVFTHDFLLGDTVVSLTVVMLPQPEVSIKRELSCLDGGYYQLTGLSTTPYHTWLTNDPNGNLGDHVHDTVIRIANPADTVLYTFLGDYRERPLCPVTMDMELPHIPAINASIEVKPNNLTMENRRLTAYNRSTGIQNERLWHVAYNDEVFFTDTAHRLQLDVPMYIDSVTIWITLSNDLCNASDTAIVTVLRNGILFPNVFTPNLETNNRFRAYAVGVQDFELWVYDRRGDLMFHSNDIEEGWDGTKNGQPCQQGSYVYKCRYRDQATPKGYQQAAGTVTLLR